MKFQSNKVFCSKCRNQFDDCLPECPKCHHKNTLRNKITENNQVFWLDPLRQGLLFLIGWLGFAILGVVFSLLFSAIGHLVTSNDQEFTQFLGSVQVNMALNLLCYIVIFIGILIVIWPFLNLLFKNFLKGKTWAYGVVGGIALILFSIVYGNLINLIYPTMGNENQENLQNMVPYFPFASILLFGIAGPLVEEFTYRVGCFSFLRRWNKVGAYIITILIFGLIHFEFNITSTEQLINELINIPQYFVAGAILCFIYEKTSWAGSSIAHVINNLYGVIGMLIMAGLAK